MIPKKRKSTQPGEILLEEFLKPLNLSQKRFAEQLGGTWTETKINEIVVGKQQITKAIASNLAKALNTSAEFWLNLQSHYDSWISKETP